MSFFSVKAQDNLLDTSSWTVGNGSVTGFYSYGDDTENIRELGSDPFANQSILWKAVPDASSNQDGGWNTTYLTADNTKTYRFSIWIKKTNSNDGNTYFGFHSISPTGTLNSFKLDGTLDNNPYFLPGNDLPQLDKWYLLVGFLHNSGYTGTSSIGGIYDPVTGNKVSSLTDFKMGSESIQIRHRAYLFYDTNTADRQYFYEPTIYEVNGQEPTIAELINLNSNSGEGSTVWNTNGFNINYTQGNVAVGTITIPPGYKLAVDGKIIVEEVKVEMSDTWPDYVFLKNYNLPTLQEVEKHIQEKGYLINIPSAEEVEANGIELGEMNKLLLEKIEELTLYLIQESNNRKNQELKIEQLQQRIIKLEYKN